MLSKKAIDEFKQIYMDEYKEEISEEVAQQMANNLLTIFKSVYRPITNQMKYGNEGIQGNA